MSSSSPTTSKSSSPTTTSSTSWPPSPRPPPKTRWPKCDTRLHNKGPMGHKTMSPNFYTRDRIRYGSRKGCQKKRQNCRQNWSYLVETLHFWVPIYLNPSQMRVHDPAPASCPWSLFPTLLAEAHFLPSRFDLWSQAVPQQSSRCQIQLYHTETGLETLHFTDYRPKCLLVADDFMIHSGLFGLKEHIVTHVPKLPQSFCEKIVNSGCTIWGHV